MPLELDESEIWDCVKHYQEHVQSLHPLIPPHDFRTIVELLKQNMDDQSKVQATHSKRSWNQKRSSLPKQFSDPNMQNPMQYSLGLMVLALGKICGVRQGQSIESRPSHHITPGFEYLVRATSIIGQGLGTQTLSVIHANILTSLYYGHLGRVMSSFQHIRFASQVILDMLRP